MRIKAICAALLAALMLAGCQGTATNPISIVAAAYGPKEPETRGKSSLVINARTGAVLHAYNADAARYPASLTKMMTLYILFEEVRAGNLSLNTPLIVSEEAASQPPSRLGLKAGSTITVREAITALAVKSSNDVAVVVAERLSGSESAFAARMTSRARTLGLSRTRFGNSTGLPDPGNVTTARDMAKLALIIKAHFPRYQSYFKKRSFVYNGRTFEATNDLLGTVRGVDGMKTGYIRASGYNLVATSNRRGKRLVVVVIGGPSKKARDAEVTALIERFS